MKIHDLKTTRESAARLIEQFPDCRDAVVCAQMIESICKGLEEEYDEPLIAIVSFETPEEMAAFVEMHEGE